MLDKQEGALPVTSKETAFLDRVHEHLPSLGFTDNMRQPKCYARSTQRFKNHLGLISSRKMSAVMHKYCQISSLSPSFDTENVDWKNLDLLLIFAEILPQDEVWRRSLLNIDDEAVFIYRALRRAKAQNVPTVLWIAEESSSASMFGHLFDKVDHVVIAEDDHDLGSEVHSIPMAIDVKSFNPLLGSGQERQTQEKKIGFLVDGSHEVGIGMGPEKASAYFEPLFKYNWWLTDSTNDLRNGDHKIHPIMRRRFMGTMRDDHLAKPLNLAAGYFLPSVLGQGRSRYVSERALAAAASKTAVATDDSNLSSPFVSYAPRSQDLEKFCTWVLTDPIGREAVQHLAWRNAVNNHTYFEALDKIFDLVGVRSRLVFSDTPHVNIVVPTIRPELIPFVLKTVENQIHKNLTLTIVVNNMEVPAEIQRLVDESLFANLHFMPNYKSIGYCINFGIEQVHSDFWAKFDDDDVYGPNYLSDMLLQQKYIDFDITGKSAIFTYLEMEDRVHIRHLQNRDTLGHFIGGGTVLARTGTGMFPEDVRGYADTLYFAKAMDSQKVILSADPFNFIQIRRADPASHTWTAGTQQLNLKGPQRSGLDMSGVIL